MGEPDPDETPAPPTDSAAPGSRALAELAGYALRYQDAQATLDVHAPDGRICIRLILAPEGPRVEVLGASLALHAERDISLSCQRFAVDASEGVHVRSGGELELRAEAAITSDGASQRIVARTGDLTAIANDDVSLDGERIRLNSPRPILRR